MKKQIIAYYSTYWILGAVVASLGPTLPALAENVGVTVGAISILFTTRSFGYLSGSLLGGWLYDRFHGHRVLSGLLLVAALALVAVPNVQVMVLLSVVFFLIGASQGGMDVGSNTLLVRANPPKVAAALNGLFFFAGLGSFLVPIYLGRVSLAWGYYGMALALLPILLWVFATPSPAIPAPAKEDDAKLNNLPLFISFAALAFIYIGAEVSFGGWLFTYFSDNPLISESNAYLLNAIFWLAIMFGRLLAIPIANRFKLPQIILGYLLGAVVSAGVLGFFNALPAVWIGTLGMGLSMAALFPSTFTFVQKNMRLSGKLTGAVWASGSTGAMILPRAIA
jgi:FHS family Na+ dependent glucose MFS transporter 1